MDIRQSCYVKIINSKDNSSYDVGPFQNSGSLIFSENKTAIDWIYKQLGLIKTMQPDAMLIKHRWIYKQDDATRASADIKVELGDFIFEIFNLESVDYKNVVCELIEDQNTMPSWV